MTQKFVSGTFGQFYVTVIQMLEKHHGKLIVPWSRFVGEDAELVDDIYEAWECVTSYTTLQVLARKTASNLVVKWGSDISTVRAKQVA